MSSSSSGQETSVEVPQSGHPASEGDDDILGKTLQDTYQLVRLIGEGGMGRVYEAHHTRMAGKRYAIKVLRAEMAGSMDVRKRFQREADAAASIHHPNVVAVNDFGYAPDGRPFLVCEYLEGIGLNVYIKQRGRLSVDEAIYIARMVCRGLEAAHEQGVIHRDLKPENVHLIGLPARPEVKVLDFGLSRFMEATSSHVTRTGIVMGTPAYMAPEQARGERADHRVDIYGVGAILYSTLTGHAPFEEESPQQAVLAVMSSEPPRPRAHVPSIPEELELVVQRAMARDPAERYQTMAELEAALATFEPEPNVALPVMDVPPRPKIYSRVGSMGDEVEAGSSRTQVVLLLIMATALLLLAFITSIAGAETLFWGGKKLSPVEFGLAVAAVIGTLITPAALLVRHLRRKLWNNSVRMVELVPRLRGPIFVAAALYGILVLVGRAFDSCAVHLDAAGSAPDISGWSGWSTILAALALIAAISVAARRRLLSSSSGFIRRMIAGPMLFAAAFLLALIVLQFGYRARLKAGTVPDLGASVAPSTPPSGAPAMVSGRAPSFVPPPPAAAGSGGPNDARAPTDAVEKASAQGVDALQALRARYPRDPDVLEPLVLALARQPEGYAQAMEALDTLLTVAPHKANDKELGGLVVRAALSSGDASNRALDIMAHRMGKLGPDMLYDLMLTAPALRRATREKLDDPEVKKNFSPELAIAYQLRVADSCEARVPLLHRATEVGDMRSVAVLMSFATGAKRGCGPRQKSPCPAACAAQAAAYKKTATDIQNRLASRGH